jgi:hypothetical protein
MRIAVSLLCLVALLATVGCDDKEAEMGPGRYDAEVDGPVDVYQQPPNPDLLADQKAISQRYAQAAAPPEAAPPTQPEDQADTQPAGPEGTGTTAPATPTTPPDGGGF